MTRDDSTALGVARAYHRAWTSGDFERYADGVFTILPIRSPPHADGRAPRSGLRHHARCTSSRSTVDTSEPFHRVRKH